MATTIMIVDDSPTMLEEVAAGRRRPVSRISLSLSEDLLCELDTMVGERGFASRSQAVATILHRSLVEHRHEVGDRVIVGTITLFYDHLANGLQQRLADEAGDTSEQHVLTGQDLRDPGPDGGVRGCAHAAEPFHIRPA